MIRLILYAILKSLQVLIPNNISHTTSTSQNISTSTKQVAFLQFWRESQVYFCLIVKLTR